MKKKISWFIVAPIIAYVVFVAILLQIKLEKFSVMQVVWGCVPFLIMMFLLSGCVKMIILSIKGKRGRLPLINPYVDVTLYDTGDDFPVVKYESLILESEEKIIYATPASTFIEKEQVVGYNGSNSGVSVRVARGVSIRTGSSKGKAIRSKVLKFNDGDYIITNKRIVFVGQNESFEFPLMKISAMKIIAKDAFIITQGSKQKNICVDISQNKYAFGLAQFAIKQIKERK